jgi:hypothetical protein
MDKTLPTCHAVIVPVPDVHLVTEDKFKDYSLKDITHVVFRSVFMPFQIASKYWNRAPDKRQKAILRLLGAEYDFNYPEYYWWFYGKMLAKAFFFQNERQLLLLNYTRVRTTEFIAYTNANFTKGDDLRVVEVSVPKPRKDEPFQAFWQPANSFMTERIRWGKFKHLQTSWRRS